MALFAERGDLSAAVKDAETIFEKQKINSAENVALFRKRFLEMYQLYQKRFKRKEKISKPTDGSKISFSIDVEEVLGQAVLNLEEYIEEKDAKRLGACFGVFMAFIRFGITSEYFYTQNQFVGFYSRYAEEILKSVRVIMGLLHKIDRSVHLPHIAVRCESIRKANRKALPYNSYNTLVNDIAIILVEYNS